MKVLMKEMRITIQDGSAPLNPAEFAEFLFFLRAALFALKEVVPSHRLNSTAEPTLDEQKVYFRQLLRFSPNEIDSFFQVTGPAELFRIETIQRNSPLEMTAVGCAFLLTLAVILSGGKVAIKLTGVTAELPALGKGISKLKEALGLDTFLKAEFGIKPTVIKLNKKEYDELFLQDPTTKNSGGFQHFLVGLQHRINKATRELELSEGDLQRIYKYKENPNKGGWQSRFNKIFGRHFPPRVSD